MAILRSADGKFYDVDDSVLAGKEVKPPEDAQQGGNPPDCGTGGGIAGLGGLIQIIVNVPPGGAGGAPGGEQGAPAGEEGDVEGHRRHWHNHWRNYWRNCWRNYWRNYYGW